MWHLNKFGKPLQRKVIRNCVSLNLHWWLPHIISAETLSRSFISSFSPRGFHGLWGQTNKTKQNIYRLNGCVLAPKSLCLEQSEWSMQRRPVLRERKTFKPLTLQTFTPILPSFCLQKLCKLRLCICVCYTLHMCVCVFVLICMCVWTGWCQLAPCHPICCSSTAVITDRCINQTSLDRFIRVVRQSPEKNSQLS